MNPATLSEPVALTAPASLPSAAPRPPVGRPPGEYRFAIDLQGRQRRWTVVIPANPAPLAGRPLLVLLHGLNSRGAEMRAFGFEAVAAPSGTIVGYPDAVDGSWNDGRTGVDSVAHQQQVDDVAFLAAVIDQAVNQDGADPARVMVAGFSNGAMMAGRLACERSALIAAVGQVSGAGPADLADRCHPDHPLAVVVIFGSADPVVPPGGGVIAPGSGRRRGVGAPQTALTAIWSARNQCQGRAEARLPASNVAEERATGCAAGSVVLYRVDGGGHEWFVAPQFDTTAALWQALTAR